MISLTDEQLGEIAQELQMGMVCYIHQQTGELIVLPNPAQFAAGDMAKLKQDDLSWMNL